LNPEKFQFSKDVATFAGFEVTDKYCTNFYESIEKFPTLQNKHDIRSWFGLINQVSYATYLATDWSRLGIGFWLLQKHCSYDYTEPFCLLVGSRFTNKAESHYARSTGFG